MMAAYQPVPGGAVPPPGSRPPARRGPRTDYPDRSYDEARFYQQPPPYMRRQTRNSAFVPGTPDTYPSRQLPTAGQLLQPRESLSVLNGRLCPLDNSTISRDDTADETLRYERGIQLALGLGSFHQETSWRASEENKPRNDDSRVEPDETLHEDDYPPYGSYRMPPPPTTRTTSYRYTGNGVYPDEARGLSASPPTTSTAGGLTTLKPNLPSPPDPYAARSDYPPPPRRTQPGTWAQRPTASTSGGPTLSGADRFTNFPNPQETTLRNDPAADRTRQFRAWQNMNNVRPSTRAPQPSRSRTPRQDIKMPSEEVIELD